MSKRVGEIAGVKRMTLYGPGQEEAVLQYEDSTVLMK